MKYSYYKTEDGRFFITHTEGETNTWIAMTSDAEKAHFLTTAANQFQQGKFITLRLPDNCSPKEVLLKLLETFDFENDFIVPDNADEDENYVVELNFKQL
jgi:hypothetical protein